MMRRIKNQPSNFIICSDNALRLLILVAGILYRGLQVMSSFSSWGCILKGYFEIGKVETPYYDNDLILTPIISPQSGCQ